MKIYSFLIVRGDDMLHIGLELSYFQFDHQSAVLGNQPRLVATSDRARVTLTFPPQVLAEQAMMSGELSDTASLPTRRAGTSRVQFAVLAGTSMELNVEGVLKALRSPGASMVSRGVEAGNEPTTIEIPWKLIVSAVTKYSGGTVVSDHAIFPITSRSGVTGLWHTQLRASDGNAEDAELALLPLRSVPGDMEPATPLASIYRENIVRQSHTGSGLPSVRRLELSPLGGSLSVTAKWPDFEWDHEVVLGRDQKIRTLATGVLYPFGHRAQLQTVTERIFISREVRLERPSHRWTCPIHRYINVRDPGVCPVGSCDNTLIPLIKLTCRYHPEIVRTQGLFCPKCGEPLEPIEGKPLESPVRDWWATAGLNSRSTLVVTESVRRGLLDREFPFDEVEILTRSFNTRDQPNEDFFIPAWNGQPLRFPLRCAGRHGDVFFEVPLVFVRNYLPEQKVGIDAKWNDHCRIPLPGVLIDMIRSRPQRESDVLEVYEMTIEGISQNGSFYPKLSQFTVEFPAVRALCPKSIGRVPLKFTNAFLAAGDSEDLAFEPPINAPIDIDFTEHPERSGGLMAPRFMADVISRTRGPIPSAALPDVRCPLPGRLPLSTVYEGATLLGLPLGSLIDDAQEGPPAIISVPGTPPGAKMVWDPLHLKDHGPFKTQKDPTTKATLTVEISPLKSMTTCIVEHFSFVLPPTDNPLVILRFDSLIFTQLPEQPPDLKINGLKIEFGGELDLIKTLVEYLQPLLGDSRPTISATSSGITAGYALALPSVHAGTFLMRNVAVNFGVNVPFSRDPVTVSLGFAKRDNPFNLSVLMFGGGGYIDIQMGQTGLTRLEASMEFGAVVAIDFIVVAAEVHALGGIRFLTSAGIIALDAFIRIGGSLEVFGLVSVSVELVVTLTYEHEPNRLAGRATLVIEVDLTLFSESVTLDSGLWVLEGPDRVRTRHMVSASPEQIFDAESYLNSLTEYYEAYIL
jgi:hypothetical protein